ncbi:hypothetical protein VUR80DRAFT_4420 [Thermomyces stellatus]
MVAIKLPTAAALAILPAASQGAQLFANRGTLDGWSYVRHEHNGKVEQVSNVVYEGPSALKMSQTYDRGYTGRYHSEVDVHDGYQRGDERFYGFSFRLSETWEFGSQGFNLAQFIAERKGAGCGGDDWMPSSMIWIQGDKLATRVVSGNYRQPDCSRDIKTFRDLATVSAGEWHKVVLQVRWRNDGSGFYKMWFDGEKVLEEHNLPTTVNDDELYQFRVGLYANSWHDDGYMEGNQPLRQVWYDEIAVGTTFADVDPDQW